MKAKEKHIRGWHFCAGDELRDGKPLVVGKTYRVTGKLVMCEHGLHWSRRIIDALQYAPGATICLVEAWGNIEEQSYKGISSYRRVIAKVDGEKLLRLFACDLADEAMDRCKVTDPCSRNATVVARRYAEGKATKEALAAAWSAARDAALAAAWSAARDAALAAACDSARAAACDAARDAALAAACDSARAAQNDRLTTLVLKAMGRKSMEK